MHALLPRRWREVRHCHLVRLLVVLVSAALLVASCSSDNGEASTPETLTAAVETGSSSTAAPTTSSTTEADSTTTTISVEDEVLEVHRRFMTEFFDRDEQTLTIQERGSRIAAIAVDPLLARTLQRGAERDAEGSYEISPGYDSNVVEVEVDGETAFVLDCSLDRGVLYDADGEVLIPADEEHRIRRTVFTLTGSGWFVSDFFTGGDVCTPDA